MQRQRIRKVAIVGDGPAATTLAAYGARGGLQVALFSKGRPGGLLIGESLIPAVVPFLRELDIEDDVRSFSVYKPGASFSLRDGKKFRFLFDEWAGRAPGYAYNVPRDLFDARLLELARDSGASVIESAASLEPDPDQTAAIRFSGASGEIVKEVLGGVPDLIVDATGRARVFTRLLGLETRPGDRFDEALFAHCEGVEIENEGDVHIDHLDRGWSWRIPLGERQSLGVVIDRRWTSALGDTAEARYDAILAKDTLLSHVTRNARRVSSVMKYNNYQNTTLSGVGSNWALVGDAFGFVDPAFSSGLFLAMDSARALARAILTGSWRALVRYEARQLRSYEAWRNVVGYFYDGRFFDLVESGRASNPNAIGRIVNPHISKNISRMLSGESTAAAYSQWLLRTLVNGPLVGSRQDLLAVR